MLITGSIKTVRQFIERQIKKGRSIGFVPTMGALHEGHASLIRKCRRENDIVVLSIFVNPKQFEINEDFDVYPRPAKKDKLLAKNEKVDIIFYPSVEEMYPRSYLTYVYVKQLTEGLCGRSRPGHFEGVTTVVTKLLNIIQPHVMYLGQKDAQQAVVIKKMASDLNIPIKIKILPTIRAKDGLALSSRNTYLSVDQRRQAPVIYRSLKRAKKDILEGEQKTLKVVNGIRAEILRSSSGQIDYVECVDADHLTPKKRLQGRILIAAAVKFGKTRLIDNIVVIGLPSAKQNIKSPSIVGKKLGRFDIKKEKVNKTS